MFILGKSKLSEKISWSQISVRNVSTLQHQNRPPNLVAWETHTNHIFFSWVARMLPYVKCMLTDGKIVFCWKNMFWGSLFWIYLWFHVDWFLECSLGCWQHQHRGSGQKHQNFTNIALSWAGLLICSVNCTTMHGMSVFTGKKMFWGGLILRAFCSNTEHLWALLSEKWCFWDSSLCWCKWHWMLSFVRQLGRYVP